MPTSAKKYIPENEFKITFARSSGAGGQNVNKTATKVVVRWSVGGSAVFSPEEKARIRVKLANRINNNDELVVAAEEERSQLQNRASATARLRALIRAALHVPKKRHQTRPTHSSKLRRLETKKRHSRIKKGRRSDPALF